MSDRSQATLERVADLLLGLSLVGWAAAGTAESWGDPAELWPLRIALAAMQVELGLLIMSRARAQAQADWRGWLGALPSFILSGLLFKLSLPLAGWPEAAKWVFTAATAWVMLCFAWLGGSFAIFPARRSLVRGGPYRLLRHPAYLGECIMAAACAWAAGSIWAWLCWAALWPLLVLRIRQEERLLMGDPLFEDYRQRTRWRLVPGIW